MPASVSTVSVLNSSNGPGYRCKCSTGCQGSPYVADGCQGLLSVPVVSSPISAALGHFMIGSNAARLQTSTSVLIKIDIAAMACIRRNTLGGYISCCPEGTHGDPLDGTRTPDHIPRLTVKVIMGKSFLLP